jgi:chromate reductase
MDEYHIAVIVGSLRKDSYNRRLANALAELAPADLTLRQVKIGDLPLYNQDDDDTPGEAVQRLKADIASAQGLLFVTPEYNRSIPGVLKNAIDHGSRPYGKNVFAGKPAGVIGASVGVIGSAIAQQHLRNILAYLEVPTMGQPEAFIHATEGLFGPTGRLGDTQRTFLQAWMKHYVDWIKWHCRA